MEIRKRTPQALHHKMNSTNQIEVAVYISEVWNKNRTICKYDEKSFSYLDYDQYTFEENTNIISKTANLSGEFGITILTCTDKKRYFASVLFL